jgi:hypothetical protein
MRNDIYYVSIEIVKSDKGFTVKECYENKFSIALDRVVVKTFNDFNEAMNFSHKHITKFKDLKRAITILPLKCDKEYQEHLDYVKKNKIRYFIDENGNAYIKQGKKYL